MDSFEVLSVNVGQPQPLTTLDGRTVQSAIRKLPVDAGEVLVTDANIEGDSQADLKVHGGVDKAIYAYPSEYFATWANWLGHPFVPGSLGENLTLRGLFEDQARIGDIWAWGSARLQITKPRQPCLKLAALHGTVDISELMKNSGRCGWYLKVVNPGRAASDGTIYLLERGDGPTVLEAFTAKLRRKSA